MREIFVTELYTLRDPIWVGDLGTEAKNPFVWSVKITFAILFFSDDWVVGKNCLAHSQLSANNQKPSKSGAKW
jgi:hypothetical protein